MLAGDARRGAVVHSGRSLPGSPFALRLPRLAVDLRALVPAPTGIAVYTRELVMALAERGEFDLLGLSHRPVRDPQPLTAAGVHLEVVAAPLGVAFQQIRLPRRLEAGDVDLFWSPLSTLPWRSPVPSVVTVHDLTAILLPETHHRKVRWSVTPFLERTLESASRVVAISEATARDVAQQFPHCRARLRVVHNGVEAAFAPAARDEIAATRARLGAPSGYLLYAGTLEPRKNVELLLEAWRLLREQGETQLPLLLAGGWGWHARALRREVARLAPLGVRATGHLERSEFVRIVQATSVFAYPSLYEGFGLPPLEAMACGVPTVVSNCSSLPEVVGDAALLVAPDDAEGLAGALSRLLGSPDLAADYARRGRARAALFTWRRAARELAALFREALEEQAPGRGEAPR